MKFEWNVLWLNANGRTLSFWLCGSTEHPWHMLHNTPYPNKGESIELSQELEDLFDSLLGKGDVIHFTKTLPAHISALTNLLGHATALS